MLLTMASVCGAEREAESITGPVGVDYIRLGVGLDPQRRGVLGHAARR